MAVVGEMHVGKGREEKEKRKRREREGEVKACMRCARDSRAARISRATGATSRARCSQRAHLTCDRCCVAREMLAACASRV